jgi:H+/Cl- antiporter ClcA
MDFMGITSVGSITVTCYLVALVIKLTPLDNKWLPIICGVLGGLLGVLSMRVMSGFPADDIITAIAVGIVSGLAATGANQVFKQLSPEPKSDAVGGAAKGRRKK